MTVDAAATPWRTEDGDPRKFDFEFEHADGSLPEELRAFAIKMVGAANVDDVDFEASEICDYTRC